MAAGPTLVCAHLCLTIACRVPSGSVLSHSRAVGRTLSMADWGFCCVREGHWHQDTQGQALGHTGKQPPTSPLGRSPPVSAIIARCTALPFCTVFGHAIASSFPTMVRGSALAAWCDGKVRRYAYTPHQLPYNRTILLSAAEAAPKPRHEAACLALQHHNGTRPNFFRLFGGSKKTVVNPSKPPKIPNCQLM